MSPNPPGHIPKAVPIAEYASWLARHGTPVVPGAPGTYWLGHETGAMMRLPVFHTTPPRPGEVRLVLRRARAALASYLLEPDDRHPANAWLYVCTDPTYALGKLVPAKRRNVRRGLRELRIRWIAPDELLAHGVQAFCDTRRRNGLSDGTPEEFHRQFDLRANCPGHAFLGAWKDEKLAAFLSITEVDDWADTVCFSMDALLNLRANDALFFCALSHYLKERACRLVSYGLSSIQEETKRIGLHAFKTKVGFEARPVHRAFIVHPLLRPFANRLILWGLNAALRVRPGDRRLRKAGGALACILGHVPFPEFLERQSHRT